MNRKHGESKSRGQIVKVLLGIGILILWWAEPREAIWPSVVGYLLVLPAFLFLD